MAKLLTIHNIDSFSREEFEKALTSALKAEYSARNYKIKYERGYCKVLFDKDIKLSPCTRVGRLIASKLDVHEPEEISCTCKRIKIKL